jgi:hypothetical protein
MKTILAVILSVGLSAEVAGASQIIAGSAEDKMFQRITTEANPDAKLQALSDFEKQFPDSKVLPDVFLMTIELYRQKKDRGKVLEYGENILKLDAENITAMMILARTYAIEGKNLDRAVDLAQQAVERVDKMKTGPVPVPYTEPQWKDYLHTTELAAKSILNYAKGVRSHRPPI